jgi:glucose-6-phosphate dehydrogenase assembly protein OpcA
MSSRVNGRALTTFEPKPVDVAKIERELAQLWKEGGKDGTLTRACMSNLIIFCAGEEDAAEVAEEAATIIQHHPSRVLLLVEDAESEQERVQAYVSAQCYLAGAGRQICSEHVRLMASKGATRALPSLARSLVLGDLPTSLWWMPREGPPLGGALFHDLAEVTDHVIYDSLGWRRPLESTVATAAWAGQEGTRLALSDLAWRRLKPWRRLISQTLDPAVTGGALEGMREITVEHGPHGLLQAWLLIGWLACHLGWQLATGKVAPGVEIAWGFRSPVGAVQATVRRLDAGSPKIQRVSIRWQSADRKEDVGFSDMGGGRLGVVARSFAGPRVMVAPEPARALLVARELPDLANDTVFRASLGFSRAMAESLLS